MCPVAAKIKISIFGGHLEFRRHFDSIVTILQLVTIHHSIGHTSKPLYTNFNDLRNPLCDYLFVTISPQSKFACKDPNFPILIAAILNFRVTNKVKSIINVENKIPMAELVRSAHLFVKISSHCKFASKNTKFTAAILDFTVENMLKVEINVRNKNLVSELVKNVHLFVKK